MILFLFVGQWILLFWTYGDVHPGFQSKVGSPHLCDLLHAFDGFPRFTSDATPADLLAASMAVYAVPQYTLMWKNFSDSIYH